ncbi:hypothetical protein [Parasphingorhabdus pacifica]
MYELIALATLVWAVLFGLGITTWWWASRPDRAELVERRRPAPRHRHRHP